MSQLQEQLKERFGFDAFREGQEDAISRLLEGKSVLAIFPTGAGKSLCYQLPALLLDGLTVVISPLIALMKDQLDFLISKGAPAARLDSTLTKEENRQLFDDLYAGNLKLLYISPERLGNERFLRAIGRQRISLLAIDEAHCISEWGHNFRPDYLKIAQLAKQLNVERTLALTATATPAVADDIRAAFDIAIESQIHTGFYRPNLELSVVPDVGGNRKEVLLTQLRQRAPGATIVYVTLQRTAEEVAEYLAAHGSDQIILCERGIRTFETATRNTLDLTVLPLLRQWTHLPILVDPSHAGGIPELVAPLSRAAIAAGADGVAVEVHPRPHEARSDGAQALLPGELTRVVAECRVVGAVLGRGFHAQPRLQSAPALTP